MQRREFILAGAAAAATTLPSWAQGKPIEGKHYQRVKQVQPIKGVIEFFWYGCPGCRALEPALHQWLARKPANVEFKRSHAVIRENSKAHQRIFFTLDAMGAGEPVHTRLFNAIQTEGKDLQTLPEIQAYVATLGIDAAKFASLYQSFTVQTRCQQAVTLMKNLELSGVPNLLVNGRYITAPSMAGGPAEAMQVVDYLLSLPQG